MTNVDYLILAGDEDFIEKIRRGIAHVLKVSKVVKNRFRFTGWDMEKFGDRVIVLMKDYGKSMEEGRVLGKVRAPRNWTVQR